MYIYSHLQNCIFFTCFFHVSRLCCPHLEKTTLVFPTVAEMVPLHTILCPLPLWHSWPISQSRPLVMLMNASLLFLCRWSLNISSLHFATSSKFHPLPRKPHGNGCSVFPNDHFNSSSVRVSFFFFFKGEGGASQQPSFLQLLSGGLRWGEEVNEWVNAESTQHHYGCLPVALCVCVCECVRACH